MCYVVVGHVRGGFRVGSLTRGVSAIAEARPMSLTQRMGPRGSPGRAVHGGLTPIRATLN